RCQGHLLERDAARRLSRRTCRAGAGRADAGAVPARVRQGGAAHAGRRGEVRHGSLVHVACLRARAPDSRQRVVGALSQVRPQPQYRRQQRARLDVRRGAPARAARRGAPVARDAAGHSTVNERMLMSAAYRTRLSALLCAALAAAPALAAAQKPTKPMKPEETEIWSPVPKVVTPGRTDADPPSDAIVLFDGKNLDQWVTASDSSPARWSVAD